MTTPANRTSRDLPAAIYCRISQDREGAGLGVKRQEEDCRAIAETHGLTVGEVYVDDDLSAYSGKPRPAYLRMLDDLRRGRFGTVIAWHTDRLHRSPAELEDYLVICEEQHVATLTVKAGELDLATPSGRAVARTLGAWARFESEHKADRIRRAMRQLRDSGKFTGGAFPFGWERPTDDARAPYAIKEDEAEVVRDAIHRLLAGETLYGIADGLNEAGHLSPTGKAWNTTTLRQLVLRSKNAGIVLDEEGEVVGPSDFPALVSEEEWRGVVAILTAPDRRKYASRRGRQLLSGLALCHCGRPVRVKSVNDRHGRKLHVYHCMTRGGGHPYKRQEYCDDYVSETVLAYLERPDVLRTLSEGLSASQTSEGEASLSAQADALRARLDGLADLYASGGVTLAQLERASSKIRDQLADIEERQVDSVAGGALRSVLASGDVRAAWEAATLDQRRAVIAAVCDVTLHPTPRHGRRAFDPSTIEITWKAGAPNA